MTVGVPRHWRESRIQPSLTCSIGELPSVVVFKPLHPFRPDGRVGIDIIVAMPLDSP